MSTQAVKAEAFRALHVPGNPFVIPNPWDAGSARMLAGLGAQALATTSGGFAFTLGRPDMGHVSRDEMLAHCEAIAAATPLPVSADLENCYGATPEAVAETVRMAAEAGLVGCSLGFPFMLTARADGFLNGAYDTVEAVRRLHAFAGAGADVIYAPLLPMEDVAAVCASAGKPYNALAAGKFSHVTLAGFAAAGVARISVGGSLSRLANTALRDCARAMLGSGDFSALADAMGAAAVEELLAAGAKGRMAP
jgi:2-methylisocitrate lyase-like PEP mutase family enzyme